MGRFHSLLAQAGPPLTAAPWTKSIQCGDPSGRELSHMLTHAHRLSHMLTHAHRLSHMLTHAHRLSQALTHAHMLAGSPGH
jgi:uncharacterized protein YciW